jgi:hypothetical protein
VVTRGWLWDELSGLDLLLVKRPDRRRPEKSLPQGATAMCSRGIDSPVRYVQITHPQHPWSGIRLVRVLREGHLGYIRWTTQDGFRWEKGGR